MDTSLQPSSRVIFLYSLPKSVVEPMLLKGVDYNSVIKMIGDYDGIEAYDLNRDFFSKPHNCNILIILGEFLEDKNALLLQDDTIFPIADLVNLISSSFREVNVIDCAWCDSGKGKTHDELKRLTNALVNTMNGYTAAETRLALYWLLLKDNTLLGRDNYRDSYNKKLSDLEAHQDSIDPKQLASLSKGTNLGTMSTSAAPWTVYRNSPFPVKVYIHADGDEIDINVEIDQYQKHRKRKLKLNNGDKISWELCFDTDPKPEYAQYLEHIKGERSYFDTWNSDEPEIRRTFNFFVEEAFPLNGFNGVLKTTFGENKPDEWPFTVNVLPYKDLLGGKTSIEVKSDENPNTKSNSINIKEVEVDAKKLEAFKKETYKDHRDLLVYIDEEIKKIHKTDDEISQRLYDDYDNLRKKINGYDWSDMLPEHLRWLYILAKRLEMLLSIKEIQKLMNLVPISNENRTKIKSEATKFFKNLFEHKIDINVFDTVLKEIYTKADGNAVQKFLNNGDSTRAFRGLAMIMAEPRKKIHHYLFEKTPQVPSKKNQEQHINEVGKHVTPFIKGILSKKFIKEVVDDYLETPDGHSSVFSYYLRRLFEEYRV